MRFRNIISMLKHAIFFSAFATGLSGNADATEKQLNNVFSGIIRSYFTHAQSGNLVSAATLIINNSTNAFNTLNGRSYTNLGKMPLSAAVDPIKTGSASKGLFGTVMMPFSAIAVRGQWDQARSNSLSEADLCNKRKCDTRASNFILAVTRGKDEPFASKLATVNSAVNSLIKYRSDQEIYGKLDYWASAKETIELGAGDCEDFAILKQTMLQAMGVPDKSLTIIVLRDNSRDLFHAVLGVSTNQGNLILDNVRGQIVTDSQLPQYQPLFSFSGTRSWIHGTQTKSSTATERTQEISANIASNESGSIPASSISEQQLLLSGLRATIQQ